MTGDSETALVPGSFDPVTLGHLDLIRRACRLFSKIYVGIVVNPEKRSLFTLEERRRLLESELNGEMERGEVEIVTCDGLTAGLAVRLGARWIVRGLRSSSDADWEIAMALSNRRCGPQPVETILLPASADCSFISSRLVREIAKYGGRLEAFVTPAVEKALRAKFRGGEGG